jgi:hypothetical protein
MGNYDEDTKRKRTHLRPVGSRSSLEKDAVVAGVDSEKFIKLLKLELDYIIKADGLLDKIEEVMFDEKFFNTLTPEEVMALYQMVTYRKETSQKYLMKILDLASRNEVLTLCHTPPWRSISMYGWRSAFTGSIQATRSSWPGRLSMSNLDRVSRASENSGRNFCWRSEK